MSVELKRIPNRFNYGSTSKFGVLVPRNAAEKTMNDALQPYVDLELHLTELVTWLIKFQENVDDEDKWNELKYWSSLLPTKIHMVRIDATTINIAARRNRSIHFDLQKYVQEHMQPTMKFIRDVIRQNKAYIEDCLEMFDSTLSYRTSESKVSVPTQGEHLRHYESIKKVLLATSEPICSIA